MSSAKMVFTKEGGVQTIPYEKTERRPLTGKVEKKVYNLVRRSYKGYTEKELQKISALDDVGDIGRTLRELRKRGFLSSDGNPPRYQAVS